MKKTYLFTAAFLLMLLLAGCNNNDNAANDTDNTNVENAADKQAEPEVHDETNQDDNETRFEVADKAADRIVKLDEVDTASVIVADETAYAAVVLTDQNNEDVTKDLEDKIANEVKAEDTKIQKVYVSANPDFVKQMNDYGEKIKQGQPIEGLFEEFTDAVQRVFPDAH